MNKLGVALISLFFLVLTIRNAYAVDIDITEFDDRLGDALGIGAFGGGLMLTMILLIFAFGLIGIVTRKQPSFMILLILGASICSFSIACGWLGAWFLILVVMMIAGMFSGKMRDWLSGG
jgi:hypothetical protein